MKEMKVLFVSSGNKKSGISPIVYNQGESLRREGIQLDYFTVAGKGTAGYLRQWRPLATLLRREKYDLIHAHYSFCGFLATLAAPLGTPIIVSLMGTFHKDTVKYYLIRLLAGRRWREVIVKSARMREQIGLPGAHIIANGVDVAKFDLPQIREELRTELGFASDQKVVIFVSNPERVEKNFPLCQASVDALGRCDARRGDVRRDDVDRPDVRLIAVFNKPHEEVAKYMLAADVLMLSSFTEGSPNVIKEAMAANCPIVCTPVGDVDYLLEGLAGTYVMPDFTPEAGAALLTKALDFGQRTEGLKKLKALGLSDREVANKIIGLYHKSKKVLS